MMQQTIGKTEKRRGRVIGHALFMGEIMERILLFQVKQDIVMQIKKLAAPKKIGVVVLGHNQAAGTLEDILEGKSAAPLPAVEKIPSESLMVFCNVSEKHFDRLLFELRNKRIPVDYKAVLTDVNRHWTLSQLYTELERERMQIERKR